MRGAQGGPLTPERGPAPTRHATRYAAQMRRHRVGTGHRLLIWHTNAPGPLQAANQMLGIMTKQTFQRKDAVPTSKPDVRAAREHPRVKQPQGVRPQRGRPNAWRCQGAKKRKAPTQAKPASKPRAKPKIWTEEEAGALYPEYAIGARVQLSPPRGNGPRARSSFLTASRGTTRDSRFKSNGRQPPLTTRRWDEPSTSGETKTVVRWSPCNYAPQT